jgi:hypothetical protein
MRMTREIGTGLGVAGALDVDERPAMSAIERWRRRGLRLAVSGGPRGPEKYRLLDLKRRRAQIRARRLLGLL